MTTLLLIAALASDEYRTALYLWDRETDEVELVVAEPEDGAAFVRDLSWSPDGQTLVFSAGTDVTANWTATPGCRLFAVDAAAGPSGVSLSSVRRLGLGARPRHGPDGRMLFVRWEGETPRVWAGDPAGRAEAVADGAAGEWLGGGPGVAVFDRMPGAQSVVVVDRRGQSPPLALGGDVLDAAAAGIELFLCRLRADDALSGTIERSPLIWRGGEEPPEAEWREAARTAPCAGGGFVSVTIDGRLLVATRGEFRGEDTAYRVAAVAGRPAGVVSDPGGPRELLSTPPGVPIGRYAAAPGGRLAAFTSNLFYAGPKAAAGGRPLEASDLIVPRWGSPDAPEPLADGMVR